MNKKILSVFISLLAVAMLTVPMFMVYAKNDKFIEVTGEYSLLYNGVNEVKRPDGNRIWSQTDCTTMWTGGIEAEGLCDFTIIFFKPVLQHNQVGHSTVFTLTDPTIDGVTYEGCELTIGGCYGGWRILGGTGDLANVHGQGTKWAGSDILTMEYEGVIHFDP